MHHLLPLALLLCTAVPLSKGEWYDTYSGNRITEERAALLRINGLVPYCGIELQPCVKGEPRRMDYSCNNYYFPSRGAALTPYHRMLPAAMGADGSPRVAKSGRELPNARRLRVSLMSDGRVSSKVNTLMLASMNVFVVGDATSVHDTANYVGLTRTCCLPGGDRDPRCIPIQVPEDDLHLRSSNVRCLNLTRAITYQRLGCIPITLPAERINTATPMLDLSHLYGSEEYRARRIREYTGGRLTAELIKGKEWPPGNEAVCINNVGNETRCHEAGDAGCNSLMGINIFYMWFFRHHNYIAERLRQLNPCWDDEKLFAVAKEINIATAHQITYYELMPANMGYEYLILNEAIFPYSQRVDDYDESIEPRVSLEYVQATRWFHTQQEGRWKLYDKRGKLYDQLLVVDLTLRTGILPLNNTIEGLTQGIFRQPGASTDYVIDPDMGERSLGRLQVVSDVMSADIMKTRDVGLPPYNKYREYCGLPVAKKFKDLYQWMPTEQADALEFLYEDVDDIDLLAGIMSEKRMYGGVVGPTLGCVMAEQLRRWRRADRFWYERTFTDEQLNAIRRITMAKMLCLHGDSVIEVQPNVFYLIGRGNKLTPCKNYPDFDLTPWQDPQCYEKEELSNNPYQYYG